MGTPLYIYRVDLQPIGVTGVLNCVYFSYLQRNSPELVKTLLIHLDDIPITDRDMYGNTPLHYAASHDELTVTNLLLPHLLR